MVPKRGVGRVRPKMKHEKGFGCFMAPKSGVGRVWEGALSSMPGEMPFCKNTLLSSMPGEMPFCKNKLKENMLGTSKRLKLIKEMPRPKCGPGGS